MGMVLAFMIEHEDIRVVYAPDVQGPASSEVAEELLELRPTVLVIGGPPTYLAGLKIRTSVVEAGLSNLARLARNTLLVVSHHLLRDLEWRDRLRILGVKRVNTYASLMGVDENCLEARRRELYQDRPPSHEFLEWLEKYRRGIRETPPL